MSMNTPAGPGPLPADPPYPATSPAVGPGAARARIRRLRQDGSTYQAIATAAGLAPATARDLASGRRRPTRGTSAAVLTLPADAIPPARLDAGGTRLRLRALHVMGHGSARMARALGVRETAISELVRGDARTVSPKLRDSITDLYDTWWDKRAPERTRAERAAATAARRRAIAGNWCAAAALDDDQLDVPGYRPRQGWKPATGTGVAPDLRPAGRHHRRRGA
jgi:plasmid maintenance system antidote protein VapI